MPARRHPNHLKAYRKRSGLTQGEVARLLGNKNGAQLSRYEKHRRLPPFETALALQAIYQAPLAKLFPGLHYSVERAVMKRRVDCTLEVREHAEHLNDDTKKSRSIADHPTNLNAQKHSLPCTR